MLGLRPTHAVLPERLTKIRQSFAKSSLKVAARKKQVKTSVKLVLNWFLKVKFLDFVLELTQFQTGFWFILKSSPNSSQIAKSPKQNIGRKMVQKVAQMATNRQIWQHWTHVIKCYCE